MADCIEPELLCGAGRVQCLTEKVRCQGAAGRRCQRMAGTTSSRSIPTAALRSVEGERPVFLSLTSPTRPRADRRIDDLGARKLTSRCRAGAEASWIRRARWPRTCRRSSALRRRS